MHGAVAGRKADGVFIDSIEPGKPNQNAFIERLSRNLGNEVLDKYLFRGLVQVHQVVGRWRLHTSKQRLHDSLG